MIFRLYTVNIETLAYVRPLNEYDIYQDIKKRVETRYKRRAEFAQNLVGCVFTGLIGLALLYFGWGTLFAALGFVMVAIAALWGIAVAQDFVKLIFAEMSERALNRELEQAGLSGYRFHQEKAKHRLEDDGEISVEQLLEYSEDEDLRSEQ
jgi:hypothetical protein